jgi:hypothetical protein
VEGKFSDQRSCLEAIGRILVDNVPAEWVSIQTIAEPFEDGAILQSFYQPVDSNAGAEPFAVESAATEVDLAMCFVDLARLLETAEDGRFKKCYYTLESTGRYHADYEY